MVPTIPTIMTSTCSMISGTISFFKSRLLNICRSVGMRSRGGSMSFAKKLPINNTSLYLSLFPIVHLKVRFKSSPQKSKAEAEASAF